MRRRRLASPVRKPSQRLPIERAHARNSNDLALRRRILLLVALAQEWEERGDSEENSRRVDGEGAREGVGILRVKESGYLREGCVWREAVKHWACDAGVCDE